MSGRWNPHGPNVAGAEWFGSKATSQPIASLIGRGPAVVATASESVTKLSALVQRTSGTGFDPTNLAVDVYDLAATVGPDTQQWIIALPEANDSAAAGWVKSNAGTETAYDAAAFGFVDDLIASGDSLAIGAADQLRYQGVNPTTAPQVRFFAGDTNLYDGDTRAGGQTLAGKRISSVEVVAVMENASSHSVIVQGQLRIGGVAYNADSGPETISYLDPALRRYRFKFYSNPATGLPWTNADALALTDGSSSSFGIAVTTKSGTGNFIITATFMQFRTLTERRVATGYGSMLLDGGWVDFPLVAPATGASAAWSKVAGHEYLFLYSLTRGSQAAQLVLLDTTATAGIGDVDLTNANMQGWTLDHGGVPLSQDAFLKGQIATLMYVGAAVSADSLPYGSVTDIAAVASAVRKQTISTHSSQDYGSATIVVSRGTGGQDADLVIRLKRASNNALLAGPTSIRPSDIPADGKYHVVRVLFAVPATLTAGVGVYVEAVSASTVSWLLPTLQTRLPMMAASDPVAIAAAAAGIGGATDSADVGVIADYPWNIVISPPAPSGLTATVATIANRPALNYGGVGITIPAPDSIEYAHLDWNSTALGAGFDFYDLQRQDDDGTWWTLARITSEASSYFNDIEGPRGTTAAPISRNYRVRVQSTDGGISAWSTFPAVALAVDNCADVVTSSNADPASALAFRDLTPTHSWDQLQTARGKMQPIMGRDYPVAFWPAEAGGEAFARKLAIAYLDPAVTEGGAVTPDRAVFDPVLALLQNRTLPYIEYADSWGRVWLTSPAVQSPGPVREEPDGRYSIEVLFTQVESDPAVIETDLPWHP